MSIFFTADTHFFHDNIRKHCIRPWNTVEEMNEALMTRWNTVVGKKDFVYHLGDFAMIKKQNDGTPTMKLYRRLRHSLNGKIFLVLGNHDSMSNETYSCFSGVYDGILDKVIDHQKITMCHYPMLSWNCSFHGSVLLHGHVHSRLPNKDSRLSFDVGVDVPEWNYTPVPWDILKKKIQEKYIRWREYWNKSDKSWQV
jgi:calcineurin-like phosphoesterase family protein